MAELPTYQKLGIQYGDLPRLATADLEVQSKSWGALSEKLDRLSSFAFKKAGEEAVMQAQKFAAENPVTAQQVAAAQNEAGAVQNFLSAFAGGGGSMYRQALSEASGITLSNQLQVEATKTFNTILKQAELGQISYEDAQLEIKDMTDGYAASVSAFNPEAAMQMRAALATRGNNTLLKVGEFETARVKAALAADYANNMSESEVSLTNLYSSTQTSIVLDTGQQLSLDDAARIELNALQNMAIAMGEEAKIKDIYQMQRKAMINGMANAEGFKSDAALLRGMRSDQMGVHQQVWDQMTPDEKEKSRKAVYDRIKFERDTKKQESDELRASLEAARADIQAELALSETVLPLDRRRDLYETMAASNALTEGEDIYSQTFMNSVLAGTYKPDIADPTQMAIWSQGIREGLISSGDITVLLNAGFIGGNQANKLYSEHASFSDNNFQYNFRTIKTDVESDLSLGKSRTKKIIDSAESLFQQKVDDAREAGITFSHSDLRKEAVKEAYDAYNNEAYKTIKKQVLSLINDSRQYFSDTYKLKNQEDLFNLIESDIGILPMLFDDPSGREASQKLQNLQDKFTRLEAF